MTAAMCVQEIRSEVQAAMEDGKVAAPFGNGAGARDGARRPLLDQSTLCVLWKERKLHLGHTRGFWLLERLSRRPNQYVTHLDLLREVWDDEDAPVTTLRSVVRHLRRQLTGGGMADLAAAIRGHNGRYILEI
jgi:DNA-binding response OmpR family regulator